MRLVGCMMRVSGDMLGNREVPFVVVISIFALFVSLLRRRT